MDKNLSNKGKKSGDIPDFMWIASIGINLVLSSLVGLFAGIYLDKWLHTKPIFMFALFIIGLAAGFRQIFKEIKKIEQDSK